MKKWLLALVLALSLTACGSVESDEEDAIQKDNTENVQEEEDKEGSEEDVEEEPEKVDPIYSFDSEQVHFELQSVNPDAPEGYEMKLLFENKMADYELEYDLNWFAVQRYLVDPKDGDDIVVEPLGTKEISLYLDRDELAELGITTVDEISFYLCAWNDEYSETEYVFFEKMSVYPTGLDEASVVVPDIRQTETMKTVLDNDVLRVVYLGAKVEQYDGFSRMVAQYCVESKTDKFLELSIGAGDRTLNGEFYRSAVASMAHVNDKNRVYVDAWFNQEYISYFKDITSPEQVTSFTDNVVVGFCDGIWNVYEEVSYRMVY